MNRKHVNRRVKKAEKKPRNETKKWWHVRCRGFLSHSNEYATTCFRMVLVHKRLPFYQFQFKFGHCCRTCMFHPLCRFTSLLSFFFVAVPYDQCVVCRLCAPLRCHNIVYVRFMRTFIWWRVGIAQRCTYSTKPFKSHTNETQCNFYLVRVAVGK